MDSYVTKLIENLPIKDKCISIDLVLDGGLFNGSYLLGGLLFLKEMEKRGMVKIKRISGCSIGSLVGFLFMIDKLDIIFDLYKPVCNTLKSNHNLELITQLDIILKDHIPDNICQQVNKRLFISYYHLSKRKKYTKSVYTDKSEIVKAIIRSCFIPYLINGKLVYENKYIDGLNPYIFKSIKGRKILYLELFGMDKIQNIFNIKNEKTNIHRALSGMLDIHNFFIKKGSTNMCSYVENWSIWNNISYLFKLLIEKIVIYLIFIYSNIQIPKKYGFIKNLLSKIIYEIFIYFLEYYCS